MSQSQKTCSTKLKGCFCQKAFWDIDCADDGSDWRWSICPHESAVWRFYIVILQPFGHVRFLLVAVKPGGHPNSGIQVTSQCCSLGQGLHGKDLQCFAEAQHHFLQQPAECLCHAWQSLRSAKCLGNDEHCECGSRWLQLCVVDQGSSWTRPDVATSEKISNTCLDKFGRWQLLVFKLETMKSILAIRVGPSLWIKWSLFFCKIFWLSTVWYSQGKSLSDWESTRDQLGRNTGGIANSCQFIPYTLWCF